MSLFAATLLTGLFLAVAGALLFLNSATVRSLLRNFPRSERAGWVLMALGAAWFLWHIGTLSEADFGAYRRPLFFFFGAIAVLSFVYAREFLAVRGLVIVYLMAAKVLLDAAYMQEPGSRLFLVAAVYLLIPVAIYLSLSPFRLRDFISWLFVAEKRVRILGACLAAYGLLLTVVALLY